MGKYQYQIFSFGDWKNIGFIENVKIRQFCQYFILKKLTALSKYKHWSFGKTLNTEQTKY